MTRNQLFLSWEGSIFSIVAISSFQTISLFFSDLLLRCYTNTQPHSWMPHPCGPSNGIFSTLPTRRTLLFICLCDIYSDLLCVSAMWYVCKRKCYIKVLVRLKQRCLTPSLYLHRETHWWKLLFHPHWVILVAYKRVSTWGGEYSSTSHPPTHTMQRLPFPHTVHLFLGEHTSPAFMAQVILEVTCSIVSWSHGCLKPSNVDSFREHAFASPSTLPLKQLLYSTSL